MKVRLEKKFSKISLIYLFLVGFLAGLFIVKYDLRTDYTLLAALIILSPFIAKRSIVSLILIGLLGLQLGLWRGGVFQSELNTYSNLYGQNISITGVVEDDPAYNDRKQTEFHLKNLITENGQHLTGRIEVAAYGASDVRRGDILEVSGKLYEGFGNKQGVIGFAEFEALGRDQSLIENFRQQYFAGVNTALPEPQSSLGLGFLVGLRTLLPADLLEVLSVTGLTHIVAVSGYNLTILVRFTRKYFWRFSKFIATAMSVFLIIGFLAVTGISPSIARASIVSGFALLAWFYGRDIKPIMLILLGASITAFISPTYMWLDIGWWLSFLAFFGVLVLSPLITDKFCKNEPRFILRTIIETTSAQAFALPLILLIFGELSLISILANVLILPLIPFAMLLTFFAGLAGMIIPQFAGWIALPAKIILTFMTDLITLMAKTPFALAEFKITTITFATIMISLLIIIFILKQKSDKKLSGVELIT